MLKCSGDYGSCIDILLLLGAYTRHNKYNQLVDHFIVSIIFSIKFTVVVVVFVFFMCKKMHKEIPYM